MIDLATSQQANPVMLNFSTFYQVAFIIPFLILVIIGLKRKYDISRWLAILLVSAFFMLAGTRITTFTMAEWSELLRQGIWPQSYAKFALGGLLVAMAGIWMARRALHFKEPVFSVFAWVAPIGLAIQKFGCLFVGCCYGISTKLPWGIHYTLDGIELHHHGLEGAIHPTQLYQVLIYLAISVSVLIFMKRFRRKESAILYAITLLFGTRFLLEFLIDPVATNVGGSLFLGLKVIQWILIPGFILSLLLLFRSERLIVHKPENVHVQRGYLQPIVIFIFVSVCFVLIQRAFTVNETLAFNIRFTVITVILGTIMITQLSPPKLRWLSPAILVIPLFLISQTYPNDPKDFEKEHVFSGSFNAGKYINELRYNPHTVSSGICGPYTAYDRVAFENSYITGSLGYSLAGRQGFQSYRIGGYLTGGVVTESREDLSDAMQLPFLAIQPYAEINWRWAGFGANLNAGYFPALPIDENIDYIIPGDNHKMYPVLPGFSARIGPYDIFDARVRFASGFPTLMPGHLFDYSIGTGLGMKNGSGIRIGTTNPMIGTLYLEGNLVLDKIQLSLIYLNRDNNYSIPENKMSNEFKLGLSYRLPVK